MAAGMVSTPFPMSHCSDTTGATQVPGSDGTSMNEVVSDFLGQPKGSAERQAILGDVQRMVLEDVDERMAVKLKDYWSRGNKMMKQIETENQQQAATLLAELQHSREKQEALKAEQDHLRTLLTSMVQQLSMLGATYGAPPAPTFPSTPTASVCDPSTAPTTAASFLQDSPPGLDPLSDPMYLGGSLPPLPAMPDFPFPAAAVDGPALPATPLSLVAALGEESPASVPTSPADMEWGPSFTFTFTLRKADGTDLGINVSHHEHDKMLRVEGVRPEGAVEAWNRQCMSSGTMEKVVIPGDKVISVNAVTDEPAKMLEECRVKQLLKFTIMRGGAASAIYPATTPSPTTLRADACEFVPGGMSIEQPATEVSSPDAEAVLMQMPK